MSNNAAAGTRPATDASAALLRTLDEQLLGADLAHLSQKVKKRRLVLFFGRASFSDNTKYLYLHALAREQNYEVLWCTLDDDLAAQLEAFGLPCLRVLQNLDRTIDVLLHAAVALFSVNPHESLGGAVALIGCLEGAHKVQLWHGVSVKRLTLQLIAHLPVRDRALRKPWVASSGADFVLSTASHFDRYWREVFGCKRLLRAGYPRNEVIVREAQTLEMLGSQLPDDLLGPLQDGRKNVLVVPTWQRGQATDLTDSRFFAQAVKFARANGVNFFFKMHPTYFKRFEGGQGAKAEGLYLLDPGVDIYPWLNRFDTLVTDYSSIMFDYLLTGRPVMALDLNPGDHQDFEPDYSLVPPGEGWRNTYTLDTFERELRRSLFEDDGLQAREDYFAKLFESDPTQACAHIMQLVDVLVEQTQEDDFEVVVP